MEFSKKSLSALCTLAIFIVITQVPLASSVLDDSGFLKAHNKVRTEAGVPPLQWNETIAEFAQNNAEKRAEDCRSEYSKGPYAENILSSNRDTTGKEAVKLWTANKKCTAANHLHLKTVATTPRLLTKKRPKLVVRGSGAKLATYL